MNRIFFGGAANRGVLVTGTEFLDRWQTILSAGQCKIAVFFLSCNRLVSVTQGMGKISEQVDAVDTLERVVAICTAPY